MTWYQDLNSIPTPVDGAVVTIGNFDGVHLGHQALIRLGRAQADALSVPLILLTFDPHPRTLLNPEAPPERLTTLSDRAALAQRAGADIVACVPVDRALLSTEAEEFIERIARATNAKCFVEGASFRFGRARRGDNEMLRTLGMKHGFELHVAEDIEDTTEGCVVSSSAIRASLGRGDVVGARRMLGRPHLSSGVVTTGAQRGRTIGFPTANIDQAAQLCPTEGVYAAFASAGEHGVHPAAVNVGPQPTFGGEQVRIEAHLIDFTGELVGQELVLFWIDRLRGVRRFDGVNALIAQLRNDVADARKRLASESAPDRLPLD